MEDGKKAGKADGDVVQLGGLEPPTFGTTIRRSNQLSYSCTSKPAILETAASENSRPSGPDPMRPNPQMQAGQIQGGAS